MTTSAVEHGFLGQPTSLLDGVASAVSDMLGISSVRHKSALQTLRPFDGVTTVQRIYDIIVENYAITGATANKDRSKQNWRWHSLQPQIAAHNRSPEVVVERAVAVACQALGRIDWANQIPVASGLVAGSGDGRRAIDLVRHRGDRHFEFIELKIASDTPLYAALEIVGYMCLWLLARVDRPERPSALLEADRIDLIVLAPTKYYERFSLEGLENAFDEGVRALGTRHGVSLTFAFEVLDGKITRDTMPAPQALLDLLDQSTRVHSR